MTDVAEWIINSIRKLLCDNEINITDTTNLIDDLGMDSILLMMLVVKIEEYYNITLPDDFFTMDRLSDFKTMSILVEDLISQDKNNKTDMDYIRK